MDVILPVLIGIGLSMDCFAVSLALGNENFSDLSSETFADGSRMISRAGSSSGKLTDSLNNQAPDKYYFLSPCLLRLNPSNIWPAPASKACAS